jgi:amino acid transporter
MADITIPISPVTTAKPQVEVRSVSRTLSLTAIVSIIFFTVSGGPYGLEDVFGSSGAGAGLLLVVLTPLIWSAPIALMCAELATAMPSQGGYYVWSKRALGARGAFCQGWWAWLTTWVDMALYPVLFVQYLAYFWPAVGPEGNPAVKKLVMITMIWMFALLNLRGSGAVGGSTKVLGVLLLSPFVLMIVIGVYKGIVNGFPNNPVSSFKPKGTSTFSALTGGMFVVMWNYLGWEGVSTVAGEMKNPRKDYPRALMISIPLITLVYLIPSILGLAYASPNKVTWTAGTWTTVAELTAGKWLGVLMSIMGMVSAIGLFSGLLMVNSRVPFVMGSDGYFPRNFMKLNKNSAPWVSLVVSALIYSAVVLLFNDFEALATVDVMLYCGVLFLEFASLLALRARQPAMHRPFKIPGGWFGAILTLVGPLVVVAIAIKGQVDDVGLWNGLLKALLLMSSGLILYPVAKWWKNKKGYVDDPSLSGESDLSDARGVEGGASS